MQIWFYCLMFALGAALGSFLCCQARRLRRKEKHEKPLGKWSVCESCGKRLRFYENIPIFSWLFLRGKCAKCGAKIGALEFLAEIGIALMFLVFSMTIEFETASGLEWGAFAVLILFSLVLAFLAIYDGAYGELPTAFLIIALILAVIFASLNQFAILDALLSVAILGGIYLLLYIVSKGKWVGDGDWLLASAIGLTLGSPWLSLLALFAANLSACLVMAPVALKRKNPKIFFGPFLVFAFVLIYVFRDFLVGLLAF